ncbi:MAG TPA: cytochrome c biogenesis protein ResB, partial [Pirellulales bacterium]|nr:cytochrome c biogenesis protein ResB [Pirellulales bacterium]
REFFRTWIAWVPLHVFKYVLPDWIAAGVGELGRHVAHVLNWVLPSAMRVPETLDVVLPFPGGFAIGLAMLVNLLAAHSVRFKVQSSGARLLGGLALIAAGVAVTWLMIQSGSSQGGIQDLPGFSWQRLWEVCKATLAAVTVAAGTASVLMDRRRTAERWLLGGLTTALAGLTAWVCFGGDAATPNDSSMRILWQLMKGEIPGLVLLAGCALVFRKRAGVVLLHAGIGLVMINEVVVWGLHVEGQMQIAERAATNYAQDTRSVELAVVDTSPPETDDVVVVPQAALLAGKRIENADLPFDVELVEYFQNATLKRAKPDEQNLADAGTGREFVAQPAKASTGVGGDQRIDLGAAYIKLFDKSSGAALGTWLVSVRQSMEKVAEKVAACGKTYDVSLRFKRDYKPYYLYLKDVRHDTYMGTNLAKNYSSELRLVDPLRHVDRDVKIWMNNPLRYAGETLYQQNYDGSTGVEVTGLQVVTNTGWMIPYVACMIVATGMLAHFWIALGRFLQRR